MLFLLDNLLLHTLPSPGGSDLPSHRGLGDQDSVLGVRCSDAASSAFENASISSSVRQGGIFFKFAKIN